MKYAIADCSVCHDSGPLAKHHLQRLQSRLAFQSLPVGIRRLQHMVLPMFLAPLQPFLRDELPKSLDLKIRIVAGFKLVLQKLMQLS